MLIAGGVGTTPKIFGESKKNMVYSAAVGTALTSSITTCLWAR